ncbi:hypothetical protein SLS54_002534 [Diplodia seriata]
MPPDPWIEKSLKDKRKFVPGPCKFVELWQNADGDALSYAGSLSWVLRQLSHAASLSYCVKTNTVRGVVFAEASRLDALIDSCFRFQAYACHPMLVPLVILAQETDRLIYLREQDNQTTLDIERKIGLRRNWTTDETFLNQTESAMRQTLEHLTMITNHKADTEMLDKNFMDTIAASIGLVNQQMVNTASQDRMTRQSLDLEYLVEYLRQSNSSVAASFSALQKRVEVQISGMYTLLGQRDSKLNLAMARDSRRLASASKRDSSSMKTIAVLTTVFLPGTFIATVFGMDVVDYKPGQFWIYLAISIPLTVVVLALWAVWMMWVNSRNEREDERAQDHVTAYHDQEMNVLETHSALGQMKSALSRMKRPT